MSRGSTHFFGDGCGLDHGSWTNMSKALDAERALADDLAAALDRYWRRINEAPTVYSDDDSDVKAVLARYREARQR